MDEILYRALVTYFNTLTKVGYKSYDVVYKLIVMNFIHDIINTEWRFYVTKKDSILMQDLLYQFLGSTCEFSFPTNCICCCKNEGGDTPSIISPEITQFKMIPSSTSYSGTQTIHFTGASYYLYKGSNFKENSLSVLMNNEVILSDLSTESTSTVSFSVSKVLEQGSSYTFKACVEDNEGNKYYSNDFRVTVSVPVEPVYMYTGTSEPAEIPTEGVILEADKYNYNSTKTFNTPRWVSIDVYKNTIIWIVLPNNVSLVSVENNSFPGDFIHGGPNEMQMQTSPVTIEGKEYTIYYRINPIATNVSYKVIVQ